MNEHDKDAFEYSMSSIYNNLMEQIEKAKMEAFRKGLEVNRIIIDEGLAYTSGFTEGFRVKYGVDNLPIKSTEQTILMSARPMVLGLAIEFQKDLRKTFGLNFILDDGAEPSREEQLEKENKRLKEVLSILKKELGLYAQSQEVDPDWNDEIWIVGVENESNIIGDDECYLINSVLEELDEEDDY